MSSNRSNTLAQERKEYSDREKRVGDPSDGSVNEIWPTCTRIGSCQLAECREGRIR